jgi:4-amino-4-deoxy-L-arabinose transferase-like glycosyltransferase
MNTASALRAQAPELRLKLRLTPLRLAVGLTLLALALRLIGVEMRPLWLDESYSAWFSSRGWHELWTQVPTYEPHPPFYYSLLKLWRALFGGSAIALRSLSILIALATVPLVIAAALQLERQRPTGRPLLRAGIAGFLAAASPMLVLLGQEARPYPLLIFAYALAVLGLLRLTHEFGDGGSGKWPSWLMLVCGTELGLWAHGLGLLYALCLAAALAPTWLKRPFDRARVARGIAAALLVALLYLPCLLMMMSRAGDWGTGWLSWSPDMLLQLFSLYAIPAEALNIGSAIAALVLVLLTKRAIQYGVEQRGWTSDRALLLLWWGPPLLAALISQLFIPIFLPRTLAATIVPACLAMSGALARAGSQRERIALAGALILPLTPGAMQIALRPASEPWDLVGSYLRQHVAAGDQVWLYPNDSALPLREAGAAVPMRGVPGDYPATAFKGPIRAGSPAVVSVTATQARAIVEAHEARDIPTVWLVTRQSGVFDPLGEMPRSLARVRRSGRTQQWGYINVTPYYRR